MKDQFEIRYGEPYAFKAVKADNREQAERMFNRACKFAQNHRLSWKVALWGRGWLEKSVAFERGEQA